MKPSQATDYKAAVLYSSYTAAQSTATKERQEETVPCRRDGMISKGESVGAQRIDEYLVPDRLLP